MHAPPAMSAPQRLEELFARLCRLEDRARDAWLEEQQVEPALRQELESLLAADSRAADAFDRLHPAGVTPYASGAPDAGAPHVPPPGSDVSRYRVLGAIGRGGMGVVVRARDRVLGRDVALKLLHPGATRSAAAKRRLLREARAAAALDHPNICTVYGVEEDGAGRLFIAMRYCEGETLAERLTRGPLAVDEALDVAAQLAAALAAAHAAGIVHCDVKPSNLVLTRTGVQLVDFGIARAASRRAVSRRAAGTLGYMAPEQLRGDPPDARTDVWAAGVVLHECLTATHPFRADSDAATIRRILGVTGVALPDELPRRAPLQRLLGRCLAPDRADRWRDGRELEAAVRALRAVSGAATPAPDVSTSARPVPRPPTQLIGRDEETRALIDALRRSRLVTVTGTAGTGKTHLVLDTLDGLSPRFSGGVAFVPLASVSDPALVGPEIVAGLGLDDRSLRPSAELLREHIADRELLLVLDNLEQVSPAAPLLTELLTACPALRVLATSRVALRLRGEQELPLGPLTPPPPAWPAVADGLDAYPATALFLERARAVRPDLRVDGGAAAVIAEICRRLDGLPLAIELAAARTRLFSPRALLERLAQPLVALDGAARDAPRRHSTLRDAIAWSYRLLEPDEQRVFRLAGVFTGGVDLRALEVVCRAAGLETDCVEAAARLVEHSLVQAEPGADRPRLTLLQTIRDFARERLTAEAEDAGGRRAHAEHHRRFAEAAAARLAGPEQALWLARLDREHDNLRAALDWAEAAGRLDIALPMAAALGRFWVMRGHVREGRARLERLLAAPVGAEPGAARAAALLAAGALAHETGDFRGAKPRLRQALSVCRGADDRVGVAGALNALAWAHAHTGSLRLAAALARRALRASRISDDPRAVGVALHNLAWIAVYRGDARRARRRAEAAILLRRRLGDGRGAAFTLANRARAERLAGELAAARASLDAARDVAAALGDRQLDAMIAMVAGQVLVDEGMAAQAAESLRSACALWRRTHHDFALGDCLNWLAAAELELGRVDEAAGLLGEADRIWRRVRGPWGRAATLFRRAELARRRDGEAAIPLLRRSLALYRRVGDGHGEAECLEALAGYPTEAGDDAAVLLAAAATLRDRLGLTHPRRVTANPGPRRAKPAAAMPRASRR